MDQLQKATLVSKGTSRVKLGHSVVQDLFAAFVFRGLASTFRSVFVEYLMS